MNGKRKINLHSLYPTFSVDYERGIKGVFKSCLLYTSLQCLHPKDGCWGESMLPGFFLGFSAECLIVRIRYGLRASKSLYWFFCSSSFLVIFKFCDIMYILPYANYSNKLYHKGTRNKLNERIHARYGELIRLGCCCLLFTVQPFAYVVANYTC